MRWICYCAMLAAFLWLGCNSSNTNVDSKSQPDKTEKVENTNIFIGTYTRREGHVNGKADGVYLASVELNTGHFELRETAAVVTNPSFVCTTTDGSILLAVSEVGSAEAPYGFIHRYEITEQGELRQVDVTRTSGSYPCHVSVDDAGEYAFVANYGGGVDMYRLTVGGTVHTDSVAMEGGSDHPRQDASHPHMAKISPDGSFLFVPDLGSNKIWSFRIDRENHELAPNPDMPFIEMPKYAGPRHLDFNPVNGDAYVINELNNTIVSLEYDKASGTLRQQQVISTLPYPDSTASSCGDIHVHPNGKYVYGSNRGHNSIVIFSVDGNGVLTQVAHESVRGDHPRNFTISADGKHMYVANQNTDNIVHFGIDANSGRLSYIKEHQVLTPVCIALP